MSYCLVLHSPTFLGYSVQVVSESKGHNQKGASVLKKEGLWVPSIENRHDRL